ncbi:hypothetical protein N7403_31935 [Pseudomonas nitroreducens]|uniref:hypothetical protein n=1 Tax=Pseudomonas nitroreducens TaxID=46680 RepID=UPI0024480E90|nr:hypothetical protein [Pseudomonas nitroreducens]MDG9858485.1 hypothetical protein [Pseudomonas nitroreducens]
MEKVMNLLSRAKGSIAYGAVALATVAPLAHAEGEADIVAGLAVAGAIAGVIAAATLKGSLNVVVMGARRVLSMIR